MALIDDDPLFTSLCSSKTLQSDEAGFFYNFYATVEEKFPSKTWIKDVYARLPDDTEKLKVLYNDPDICAPILGTLEHVRPVFRAKDAKISIRKREEAHSLMKQGKLQQALILASQAVCTAPKKNENITVDNGLSLAFAFWIRAEVFLELLDGQKALRDLQLSAKYGVPANQNPKYYARLAKCYKLLGDDKKLEVTLNLFRKLNAEGSFDEKALAQELVDLEEKLKNGEKEAFLQEKVIKKPSLIGKENDEFPCASDHLTLKDATDQREGRYFIAKKDIPAGKQILAEKAVASCLYPRNFGSHCTVCFERLIAPIPCLDCSGLAFCSVQCRDSACDSYHKYECEYLNMMIGSGMSILCYIAMRIISSAKSPSAAVTQANTLLEGLCSHSDVREPEDHFQRALMVSFILRILQKSGFFGRRLSEAAEPTNVELQVGVVLLKLLQSLQFNAHEIYGTKIRPDHRINGSKIHGMGVAIYRTASLFNHDCYPSVTRYFQGTDIVLTTIRPINSGDMISENYGPVFSKVPLKERQRTLRSRYWFRCPCQACREDWPLYKDMSNLARIKCPTQKCTNYLNYPKDVSKSVKCLNCKSQVNLKHHTELLSKCELLYREGAEFMEANKLEAAIDRFEIGLNLFGRIAIAPHKDTHMAQSSFRSCLAYYGNTFIL